MASRGLAGTGRATSLNDFLYGPKAPVAARARLDFAHHERLDTIDEPMRGDISGVAASGKWLWLVSDETCSVERLRDDGALTWRDHASYDLRAILDLPGETEIDLEGVEVDGDWLWLVGSHALKRKKVRPDDEPAEAMERLAVLEREHNRSLIACLPLEDRGNGPEPCLETADGRRAAQSRIRPDKGNRLARHLAKDEHVGASVHMPAKENGLDIEGIAVRGDRILLGLRGPVLRGVAVLLELKVKRKPGDGGPDRLKLRKAFGGRRYRKAFVDLGGLGIRDLAFDGDRLLVLAGPTMDLSGPLAVLAIDDPWGEADGLRQADGVGRLLCLPHGAGTDHAEGLTPLADGRLLVVFDSPDPARLPEGGRIKYADLYDLP